MQEELEQAARKNEMRYEMRHDKERRLRDVERQRRADVRVQPDGRNWENEMRHDKESRMREDERQRRADVNVQPDGRDWTFEQKEKEGDKDKENREVPERWEKLVPDKVKKIRKPPAIEKWFGMINETDTSDDTEDTDDIEWTEVSRKKKEEQQRMRQRKRIKEIESSTLLKAAHMVGVGPVNVKWMEQMRKEKIPYGEIKKKAVEDLLATQLAYEPKSWKNLRSQRPDYQRMETTLYT